MSARKREDHSHSPSLEPKKKAKTKVEIALSGSHDEVLQFDAKALIDANRPQDEVCKLPETDHPIAEAAGKALPAPFTEIQLDITVISSSGDGLSWDPDTKQVYVVPFTAPGDTVIAKVIKHLPNRHYTLTDFVKVIKASPLRDDSLIRCKYFQTCSGCQFQMLPYETQLSHKKTIIERAYQNFSGLDPALVPAVRSTIGSTLQYGYRTKLTPHFDGPPGYRRRRGKGKSGENAPVFQEVPPIGFMQKGMRKTIDIEDCPIGTDAVRLGMKAERTRVAAEINTYKRGATLLLRESTKKIERTAGEDGTTGQEPVDPTVVREYHPDYVLEKKCVTDPKLKTTEYIDSYIFENSAGAFFQNNNSILPTFTKYIRDNAFLASPEQRRPPFLIDAYCGSGLFTVILSSTFLFSTGIDISPESIHAAVRNAQRNHSLNANFQTADAAALFASIVQDGDDTVVVIDPPRKGCDEAFLRQLAAFGPARILYVSCNVHTQARDVGFLINDLGSAGLIDQDKGGATYEIESLQGFDFFPQTSHVESVAVLNKVKMRKDQEAGEVGTTTVGEAAEEGKP